MMKEEATCRTKIGIAAFAILFVGKSLMLQSLRGMLFEAGPIPY
jgi:hypothetical protein